MTVVILLFIESLLSVIIMTSQQQHQIDLQFYGDVSIEQHLDMVCNVTSHQQAENSYLQVILIENLIMSGAQQTAWKNNFYQYLQKIKCKSRHVIYYNVMDITEIGNLFFFRSVTIQVVLDVTLISNISEHSLQLLLSELSRIYAHCLKCAPGVVLLSVPIDTLAHWSMRLVSNDLQAILVSRASPENKIKHPRTLHIRPVLDGCLQHPALFMPQDKAQYERLKVQPQQCNLNSVTLNVTVNHYIPFCDISRSPITGQVRANYGLEIEILQALERKLNFRAHLVDGYQVWGSKVNGSWIGTLNQVLNKTSNFALCCISRILQREEVVDFTDMTYLDHISFATLSPGLITHNIILATPLDSTVWLLIVASFLSLTATVYAINRVARHRGRSCSSYTLIYLNLFSIYINKSVHRLWTVQCNSIRLIYLVWMWAALILAIVYCARLYSLLTVPHSKRVIDTVQELINAAKTDTHNLVCKKYSSLWNILMEAQNENNIYYPIGRHIRRTKKDIMTTSDQALIKVAEESAKNIVIGPRLNLQIFTHLYAKRPIHIASETISLDFIAILLPKRSPLRVPFNRIISKLRQLGLLDKWLKDSLARLPPKLTATGSQQRFTPHSATNSVIMRNFSLQDMHTIFMPWFIGNAVAFGVFLLEVTSLFCQQAQVTASPAK